MWILSPWHAFVSTWLETSAQWSEREAPRLCSSIFFFSLFFFFAEKVPWMEVRG